MFLKITTIVFYLAIGLSQFFKFSYSSLIIGVTALIIAVALMIGDTFTKKN